MIEDIAVQSQIPEQVTPLEASVVAGMIPQQAEQFIDPEAAVQAALQATHEIDVPLGSEQGIRPLGEHMFGLLSDPTATDEHKVGARIILMSGTPAERIGLVLYDTLPLIQKTGEAFNQNQVSMNNEQLRQFGADTSAELQALGSLEALETSNAAPHALEPKTQEIAAELAAGKPVTFIEMREMAGELIGQALEILDGPSAMKLLNTVTSSTEELSTILGGNEGARNALATRSRELTDDLDRMKVSYVLSTSTNAAESQALWARRPKGYNPFTEPMPEEEKYDEFSRSRRDLDIASSILPDGVAQLIQTDTYRRANPVVLKEIIGMVEGGATVEAVTLCADRLGNAYLNINDPLDDRWVAPEKVNEIAGLLTSQDETVRAAVEAIVGPYHSAYFSKMPDMLALADIVKDEKLHSLIEAPDILQGVISRLIPTYNEAAPDLSLDVLKKFADVAPLPQLIQLMGSAESFTQLVATLDKQQLELPPVIAELASLPQLAQLCAKGGLEFYGGSNTKLGAYMIRHLELGDTQLEQAQLFSSALHAPELEAVVNDEVVGPMIIKNLADLALNPNVNIRPEQIKEYVEWFAEVAAFPGALEDMAVVYANPEIAKFVTMTGDHTLSPERVAKSFKTLAEAGVDNLDPDTVARIRLAAYSKDVISALAHYQTSGLATLLEKDGLLEGASNHIVEWVFNGFTDETLAENMKFLNDPDNLATFAKINTMADAKPVLNVIFTAAESQMQRRTDGIAEIMEHDVLVKSLHDVNQFGNGLGMWLTLADNDKYIAPMVTLLTERPEFVQQVCNLSPSIMNLFLQEADSKGLNETVEIWQKVTAGPLMSLISNTGAGYGMRRQIIDAVFESLDPIQKAKQFESLFTRPQPLWLMNYEIARMSVGEVDKIGYQVGMQVDAIPVALPSGLQSESEMFSHLRDGSMLKQISDMNVDEKRLFLDVPNMSDEQVAALTGVRFKQLASESKGTLLAYRLFETIEMTRDEGERAAASVRNMTAVHLGRSIWEPGVLTHGTRLEYLDDILTDGNLAGETIGDGSRTDSYPFNVDLVVLAEAQLDPSKSHHERLDSLPNKGHAFGGLMVMMRREGSGYRPNEEFDPQGYSGQHRLMFGGVPATQISAIALMEGQAAEGVSQVVVEAGMYIPVYDPEGRLVLTPEMYEERRRDGNYEAVKVEIIDSAFARAGSQAGSNEGSEFLIPSNDGEPGRFYVKFGDKNADHMWTELLADSIYRTIDPQIVPETKPVLIEGRLARASRIVADEGQVTNEARNAGFVADVLLANWDAVFNSANLVMHDGRAMRIDTGGSLDFRARGDKKGTNNTDAYGAEVTELAENDDRSKLGRGMRSSYDGLTDEMIRTQAAAMYDKLPDSVIDQLVDGIRRSSADRTYLKVTLKARRDAILSAITTPQT